MTELRNRWTKVLEPLFPKDSEFKPVEHPDHYHATVSWKLADPLRPNKRSKTIKITVPEEVVDDYKLKSATAQMQDDDKLKQFVSRNLKNFDPNHDNPVDMGPPEVTWLAGSDVLNNQ